MKLEIIKKLSEEGERDYLPVPSHDGLDSAKYALNDVKAWTKGFTLAKSIDELIVYGYASIDVIDLEGDEITLDCLQEMFEEMKKTPKKFWNVMSEHEGIQIGEILLEWNDLKTQVDDKGFFIIVKLRKDIEAAQRIWEQILSGGIKSFSIHIGYEGGEDACTERVCSDNRCWRKIIKAQFLEVSFVKSPANPLCLFSVPKEICEKDKRCKLKYK